MSFASYIDNIYIGKLCVKPRPLSSSARRTITSAVGVSYSSPDSPYAQLCAVYVCPCGATHSGVGRQAGELPAGWEQLSESVCICEHCAGRLRAGEIETPTPA
jgi:hypothetical protein